MDVGVSGFAKGFVALWLAVTVLWSVLVAVTAGVFATLSVAAFGLVAVGAVLTAAVAAGICAWANL